MESVNIHEAKTHFSRLVERAAAGEEIIIAKGGKPVAKLVPIGGGVPPRLPGLLTGRLHVPEDFDDPLPPEVLKSFYEG